VARSVGVAAGLAVSGDRAVNEPGLNLPEVLVAETELFHHPGAILLEHDVVLLEEAVYDFFAAVIF